MKLCVLNVELDDIEPLHTWNGMCLYLLPISEYKKCILRGVVSTNVGRNARICYLYTCDIFKGRFKLCEESISKDGVNSYFNAASILGERFILGEEMIKKSLFRRDYENHFNIIL